MPYHIFEDGTSGEPGEGGYSLWWLIPGGSAWKGLGVSLVEVYERVGKFVILVCKNAKRANRCMAVKKKVEKTGGIYSYV